MKASSPIKKIAVRITSDNVSEYQIDSEIFDDPLLEAATRAVEAMKKRKHANVRAVMECWDTATPKKTVLYNTYWILVNAACYAKAELLREKFKVQTDLDLAKEPIHASTTRSNQSSTI